MLGFSAGHPTASGGVKCSHLPLLDVVVVTKFRSAEAYCHETLLTVSSQPSIPPNQ